jgi:DNA segregation ATPase FtsK/SpoIIIE, S-DNA-T family
MKIKLTLARPGSSTVDLAVTAEQTSSIADIARELHNADPTRTAAVRGVADTLTLRVHDTPTGRLLDPFATLLDSRLGSGTIVSLAAASEQAASGSATAAAIVSIVAGPGAGKTYSLPAGSSTIGRDRSARVVLDDPLVSKVHIRINVTDVAEVIDLGSANGTLVNGEQVDRAILRAHDQVTIGDTTFSVAVSAQAAAEDLGGVVHLNRSPRLDPIYVGPKLKAPEIPERQVPQKLPWLALAAPLVMGIVLFAVTRNLLSVVFVALSPILILSTFIDNRIQIRRQAKQARKDFLETVTTLEQAIDREHDVERAGRMSEAPSVADLVAHAGGRGSLLWTRRPEHSSFLALRLGIGPVPSRMQFEMPSERKGLPEFWNQVEALNRRALVLEHAPVVENFRESGNVGIAGPESIVGGVARALVAQVAALHSPAELAIVAVASTQSASQWSWLKWLPHVGSPHSPLSTAPLATGGTAASGLISELEELIASRVEAQVGQDTLPPLPAILVLVEDDAPVERARMVGLAESGPAVGVHLLWVAPSLARVPGACRTFLQLGASSSDALAGFVHDGRGTQPVQCESLDDQEALNFARGLAPVVDAGARVDDSSDLPRSISFLHLVGTDIARDSSAVLDRWQQTNSILTGPMASPAATTKPNLRAVFGQGASEPFAIDLRADGPHALVGGTTGSGKSEFLQAWVLGLAAAHSPQRVSFLFVDYKGGAAFADCVELPHTVGLVTDLSQHLVRRALASLRAELHYRERLFQEHKVKDIIEFEGTGSPDVPPSLIIVVDEFAALVKEVPDFVDGVVDVAQRGRSLGLHLILATQRPAGVIGDSLRANTNLRIALRMADEDDSTNVLDVPLAASFDSSIPGRAAAKMGAGRIRTFQSGYAGGWTSDIPEASEVLVEELSFGPPSAWKSPKDPEAEAAKVAATKAPTDIKRVVATVKAAATAASLPALRKPWLPTLAEVYDFSLVTTKRTDEELLIGIVDDAANQAQPTISYIPDRDGNMAILGTGGSGKSTVLRSLAVAAATTLRGGPVHVYGLDFGASGLTMLEGLPHVGAIVNGDDDERVERLLRWLRDLVEQRAVRYAEVRAGSIVDYRKQAKEPNEPRILLLLDGMAAFREAYETTASSAWFSVFSQIATDGRKVGVHIVVTGDRSGAIPPSLSSSIQRRLVLRMASADDYGMLGVPSDILNPLSPPGRGILDELETQVAVLGGDPNVAVQSREIDKLAAAMRDAGITVAPPVQRLTDSVALASLPDRAQELPVIGVADDTLAAVGAQLDGSFFISGPPGSGRSTALAVLATSASRASTGVEFVHISPRRTTMGQLPIWSRTASTPDTVAELVASLNDELASGSLTPGSLAVFIENITDFGDSAVEQQLENLVKSALKLEHAVVAEGETSSWGSVYDLAKLMKSGRRGLILQPEPGDEDLLKASFGRIRRGSFPPGRGFLVQSGRSRKVQVATLDDANDAG